MDDSARHGERDLNSECTRPAGPAHSAPKDFLAGFGRRPQDREGTQEEEKERK